MQHVIIDATDIVAQQRAVDAWSLDQARIGLAMTIAKRLPMSTEMYRRSVERLERKLA